MVVVVVVVAVVVVVVVVVLVVTFKLKNPKCEVNWASRGVVHV